MHLELSGEGANVFSKALSCIYRIHEYVTILTKADGLEVSAADISRSTFVSIRFPKNLFLKYEYVPLTRGSQDKSAYQVSLIYFLTALRTGTYIQNIINKFSIDFSDRRYPDNIVVTVTYECGITKKMILPYKMGDSVKAAYNAESLQNQWEISSLLCRGWFRNFHRKLEDVSINAKKSEFVLKSFYELDENEDPSSIATRNLSTELQLSVSDFDKYEIKTESEITISLRNIKNIFYFADSLKGTVKALFGESGSPIVFKVDAIMGNLYSEFALATLINPGDLNDDNVHSQPVIKESESIDSFLRKNTNDPSLYSQDFNQINEPLRNNVTLAPIGTNFTPQLTNNEEEEIPPSPDIDSNICNWNITRRSYQSQSEANSNILTTFSSTPSSDNSPILESQLEIEEKNFANFPEKIVTEPNKLFPNTVSTQIQSSQDSLMSYIPQTSPKTPPLPSKRVRSSNVNKKTRKR